MNTDKIYAEHIANQYAEKETTKVKQLKKLDAKAKKPSLVFAYCFGSASSLVLGVGMCLAMQIIATGMPAIIGGVMIGVLGIILMCLTYPIYKKMRENGRKKYGSAILRLANEISEGK